MKKILFVFLVGLVSVGFSQDKTQDEIIAKINSMAIDMVYKEMSAADKLEKDLKNESSTKEDKLNAIKEFQSKYPGLLSNVEVGKDEFETVINGVVNKNEFETVIKALKLNTEVYFLKAKQKALQILREEATK